MSTYTTDGKVAHYSAIDDVNAKLARVIGQKFLDYRKQWDAANNFELETDFPLFLHFDLNQKCNYRCPQCIIAYPDEVSKYYNGDSLDFSLYKSAIDEGSSYNCPSVSVQGNNEPLLIPNLEEYIKYASDRGFIDIMFNTNGSLMTRERARRLLDSGVTRIRFSLDAFSDSTYNQIRVGGNYTRVLANIMTFLEEKQAGGYKLPVVGVSFCLQNKNFHELEAFTNYWKDIVDLVTIQNFLPPTPNLDFSCFHAPTSAFTLLPSNSVNIESFKCVQPYQRLVLRNQDITPCCAMYSTSLSLGRFPETSLHQAWNSQQMRDLRHTHKNGRYSSNEVCRFCVNSMASSATSATETPDILH
jgi:sulfatase maturation enzyme AslB (radical SAM superfamily)